MNWAQMKTRYLVAAAVLLTSFTIEPRARAQGAPTAAAAAARRQKLAAQQAAAVASAKAAATAAPTTAPTPVATINPPAPTATPTAAATTTPTAPTAVATAATSAPKATASAAPASSGSAAPVHPDTTAIALDIQALRKSRPDRRHAEFLDMHSRWGNLLSDPRSTDELKLHAQRLAYLQRMRALGAKDPAFVKGVDELITREETRNSDALNALRSGALRAARAAAPVAGAAK